jgi:uncharacterized protein YacL
MNTENNKKKLIQKGDVLAFILVVVLSIIFIVFFALVFKWGRIFEWRNDNYVADNSLLGTYGDFIGGVLGTILIVISTFLVVRTFKHQGQVT